MDCSCHQWHGIRSQDTLMTRLWFTGLEAGSLDVFPRVDNAVAISAVQARTGDYSLHIPGADDRAWTTLRTGYTELFLRIGLYITGGANDRTFCTLCDNLGAELLTFQVRQADSAILVRRGDHNDALIAAGGVVPTNTWCCIEIRILIDNAIGVIQVRIDGVQIINFSGDTQIGADNEVLVVVWGASYSNGAYICYGYYDDLAINSIHGIRNNSWLGLGGIVGLVPTGAGNYIQLTPSAGANWAAVNEVPPDDDAAYVESLTIDLKDTYIMQDLVITPGQVANITAVQWLCRAYNTVSQGGNFARLFRLYGIDHQGDDVGYDRSYDYHPEVLGESPATGQEWTEDDVNALEAGVMVR